MTTVGASSAAGEGNGGSLNAAHARTLQQLEEADALITTLRDLLAGREGRLRQLEDVVSLRERQLTDYRRHIRKLERENEELLQRRSKTEQLADRLWQGFQKFRDKTGY